MTDTDETADGDPASLVAAVDEFLSGANRAYGEYERGYADADATLGLLEGHVEALRAARDAVDD